MSSIYLYYSDACVSSPHNIQDRTLCDTSHNQSLTSVTKKSIPNVKGILDQPLVIRYSKNVTEKGQAGFGWDNFIVKGHAEDHTDLVIKFPVKWNTEAMKT